MKKTKRLAPLKRYEVHVDDDGRTVLLDPSEVP